MKAPNALKTLMRMSIICDKSFLFLNFYQINAHEINYQAGEASIEPEATELENNSELDWRYFFNRDQRQTHKIPESLLKAGIAKKQS